MEVPVVGAGISPLVCNEGNEPMRRCSKWGQLSPIFVWLTFRATDLRVVCSYNMHVHIIDEAYVFTFTQYVAIRLGWRKFHWWKYGPSSPRYFLRTAMLQDMPLHFHLWIGMKSMLPHQCWMKLVQPLETFLRPDRVKYEQVQPLRSILNELISCTGNTSRQTWPRDQYEGIYHDTSLCSRSPLTWYLQFSHRVCYFDGVKLNPIHRCYICL